MSERQAGWLSVGIFGALVFAGVAAFGYPAFYAALASLYAVAVIGGSYIYQTQAQQRFESTWSVAAVGMVILASFGADCAIGSRLAPGTPFIDACTSHSGIGFPLTVGLAILLLGGLFVAKMHSALLRRFGGRIN